MEEGRIVRRDSCKVWAVGKVAEVEECVVIRAWWRGAMVKGFRIGRDCTMPDLEPPGGLVGGDLVHRMGVVCRGVGSWVPVADGG